MKVVLHDIKFPGLNEIIASAKKGRKGYQPYAEMKYKYTNVVYNVVFGKEKFDKVSITIDWYEPNSRRDIDNIIAGSKFILDGLVKAEIIKDDSQRYVKSINNNVFVDKNNPRIEITLKEI